METFPNDSPIFETNYALERHIKEVISLRTFG